jgi:hypothetical protein
MTDELRQHLLCIITDAIEWAEDHLAWLAYNSQESDRGGQLRDTERSIDFGKRLLDHFTVART